MVLESHAKFDVTQPDFLGNFFPKKLGKWAQNRPKTFFFFQFIGKFGNQFLLNLIYNENLFVVFLPKSNISENFCSCDMSQNAAHQIAGFFNQPYLQNESMKYPDFYMVIQETLKYAE